MALERRVRRLEQLFGSELRGMTMRQLMARTQDLELLRAHWETRQQLEPRTAGNPNGFCGDDFIVAMQLGLISQEEIDQARRDVEAWEQERFGGRMLGTDLPRTLELTTRLWPDSTRGETDHA